MRTNGLFYYCTKSLWHSYGTTQFNELCTCHTVRLAKSSHWRMNIKYKHHRIIATGLKHTYGCILFWTLARECSTLYAHKYSPSLSLSPSPWPPFDCAEANVLSHRTNNRKWEKKKKSGNAIPNHHHTFGQEDEDEQNERKIWRWSRKVKRTTKNVMHKIKKMVNLMTNDIKVCNGSSFQEYLFFSVGHNFSFSPGSFGCLKMRFIVLSRQFSLSNN